MKKRFIGGIVLGVLVLVFAYLYFFTALRTYFDIDVIRGLVESAGMFAPILYGLIYGLVILFFIPASPLTVLAGVLFGNLLGTTIVVISATISASIAFLIARYFGSDVVSKLSGDRGVGKWIKKIEDNCERNGFVAFFILRSLFLPYIILSYAAGLVKVARFRDFVAATFVTNIIYSFMFVYLGDSLLKGPKALLLPVILVVLVLQVPKIVKKFTHKKDPME